MILDAPIATGNTAEIYLHEGKLVKLFKAFLPDTAAEYEANKQRYAYSCGLPVPYVFEVTKINGIQAIIMEFVPGITIGSIILDDMAKAKQLMNLSVDVQLKIHAIDINASGIELMTDKLHRQILSASTLNERQKYSLIEKLYSMQYEKRLCHGDYHVHNLILRGNTVTIIDWVDSIAGDTIADAYRTYLLYSQYSMELSDLYLRLYCEKSGLSHESIFAWEPIIAGARLSENINPAEANRLLEIVKKYYSL